MKKALKSILKYPIIILNRIYIYGYFKITKNNDKYKEIQINESERIMVLSPHVDDESIGLGGTLIKYGQAGNKMSLVYLTDGSGSTSNKSLEETIEERRQEGIQVEKSYGFESLYFLDQVDGDLNANEDGLLESLKRIIEKERPDSIFTPFLIDGNRDHIETTRLLSKVLDESQVLPKNIYLYQVNNFIHPSLVNTISRLDEEVSKIKDGKYEIFKSQWAMGFDIYSLMERARGSNYGTENRVEVFVKVDRRQLKHGISYLRSHHFNPQDFKQISSEFTFLRGVFKNYQNKNKYNKKLIDILEQKMGGSS